MSRSKHPNKHIEAAVAHAEQKGWRCKMSGGAAHCWGTLLCPREDRDGCRISVNSTPRNPENHARQIQRKVDSCGHADTEN